MLSMFQGLCGILKAILEFADCRFKADSNVHGKILSELETSEEAMKGFERKDIKLREDLKHLKGKLKKLTEKIGKDAKKAEVGFSLHLNLILYHSVTIS